MKDPAKASTMNNRGRRKISHLDSCRPKNWPSGKALISALGASNGKAGEEEEEQKPARGVEGHHAAVGSVRVPLGAVQEKRHQRTAEQGPNCGAHVPHEVVPGKHACAVAARDDMAQTGVLHGQEGANLLAGRADDAKHSRESEQPKVCGHAKDQPCRQLQEGARLQHEAPAHHVGPARHPQGHHRVAEKGQREEQPDLRLPKPHGLEVQYQKDREQAVAK